MPTWVILVLVSWEDRQVVENEVLWVYCGGHDNDMVVAPNGNAYVGNFGFDLMGGAPYEPADIVLVRPGGTPETVATGLAFPNGMVITPDGNTLIVNELFGNKISQFEILGDCTLGPRRAFANF